MIVCCKVLPLMKLFWTDWLHVFTLKKTCQHTTHIVIYCQRVQCVTVATSSSYRPHFRALFFVGIYSIFKSELGGISGAARNFVVKKQEKKECKHSEQDWILPNLYVPMCARLCEFCGMWLWEMKRIFDVEDFFVLFVWLTFSVYTVYCNEHKKLLRDFTTHRH